MSVIQVWWSWFWRMMLVTPLSLIIGGLTGFAYGQAFPSTDPTMLLVPTFLGFAIGIGMSIIPIWWMMRKYQIIKK